MDEIVIERMGTIIKILVYHPHGEALLKQADLMLEDYENRFSANDKNSDLMTINNQAGISSVQVDADLFKLIEIGKRNSLSSNKAFNIAIGPLVKLWKIGFDGAYLPEAEKIKEKLKLIDPNNIELDKENKRVYLKKKGMEIDLGAIAKGYFADQLKTFFKNNNVKDGFIDLGGNVLTIGENPKYEDGHWRIGIQKPTRNRADLVGAVLIKDKSVVTSGIYERSFEQKGKTYHHIFDSNTGYPIENNLASVTIISDQSILGELFTTILFSMDAEQAIEYVERLRGVDAVVITKDQQVKVSKAIQPYTALFKN